MIGQSTKKTLMKSEDRKSDLALLRDLKDRDDLSEDEYDAFGDMYERLENGTATLLSDKQRKWAEDADRVGVSYARRSAEQAHNVAHGREVVLGGVLGQDSLRAALTARRR